jgi:Complex 1 protein (LYR family)
MASAAAAAMAVPPSRAEVLSLLRSLLRIASKFNDYKIKEYLKQRSFDAFRENKSLSNPSSLASSFSDEKHSSRLQRSKQWFILFNDMC